MLAQMGPPEDSKDTGRVATLIGRFAPWLAAIGRLTRHQVRFTLLLIGAGWGTLREPAPQFMAQAGHL